MTVRAIRKAARMSQGELAVHLGVSKTQVSRLEAGQRTLDEELAGRLAELAETLELDVAKTVAPRRTSARRVTDVHVLIVSTDDGELYQVAGRGETVATYSHRAAKAAAYARLTERERELRAELEVFDLVQLHHYDSMRGWNDDTRLEYGEPERALELVPLSGLSHGGGVPRRESDTAAEEAA